jgi:[ribosomal protein S5]-alanine N-acetyltransferase
MYIMTTIPINAELTLTDIRSSDAADFVRYLNDPIIFENTLMIPSPYTEADAEWFINHNRDLEAKYGMIVNYAVRTTEGGVIGVIGRVMGTAFGGNHKGEIGYWIARPFWNRGYATLAIQHFTDFCFEHTGLVRIEAHVFAPNIASQRALEKAGFTREGYCRKFYRKPQDGLYRDAVLYAKIKEFE